MTTPAVAPEKKDKGGDDSELNGIVDQETRGGNLSSSAHDHHSSNLNLHGYGTASMTGKPEAFTAGTITQGPSSAVKAQKQYQWESDASNSHMYAQFAGLKGRKFGGDTSGNMDSPDHEHAHDGALRTDDE